MKTALPRFTREPALVAASIALEASSSEPPNPNLQKEKEKDRF